MARTLAFLALALCGLLAAATDQFQLDDHVTFLSPTLDINTNTIESGVKMPYFDYTWTTYTSPYTGEFYPVPSGCHTYTDADIDVTADHFECGGFQTDTWKVYRKISGETAKCSGTHIMDTQMRSRINNMATHTASSDTLYEAQPTQFFITPRITSADTDNWPTITKFVLGVLNCTAMESTWTTILDGNTNMQVSLLRSPFAQCGTHTGAYFYQLGFDEVADTRTYTYYSEPWAPTAFASSDRWVPRFKETVAESLGFTDLTWFDASLATLTLPDHVLLSHYVSFPTSSAQVCLATNNKAIVFYSSGHVYSSTAAPTDASQIGSCDQITYDPAPASYADRVNSASVPDATSWAALTSTSTVPGYFYPLNPDGVMTSMDKLSEMYQGRLRHFLQFSESRPLTFRGNCTDGHDVGVFVVTTSGNVKQYTYTDSVQIIPASGSNVGYRHVEVSYRFTVDETQRAWTVTQLYDTAYGLQAELLSVSSEPCSALDPAIGANWNVTHRVRTRIRVTVSRSLTGTNVAGVSTIVPIAAPFDLGDGMPLDGCYGYPQPQPQTIETAPTCASGTCYTDVVIESSCWYPNALGTTFSTSCPNVGCDPSIYDAFLGVYRFGAVIKAGATWETAVDLNAANPSVVTMHLAPRVFPFPASNAQKDYRIPYMVPTVASLFTDIVQPAAMITPLGVVTQTHVPGEDVTFGMAVDADLRDYVNLGMEEVKFCYGPVSTWKTIIDNPPADYDCELEPTLLSFKTVWTDGADSGLCDPYSLTSPSTLCFETGYDKPCRGTDFSLVELPVCNNPATADPWPGCDACSMRVNRLTSAGVLGPTIVQRPGSQLNGLIISIQSKLGVLGLLGPQLHVRRLLSLTQNLEVNGTALLIISSSHDLSSAENGMIIAMIVVLSVIGAMLVAWAVQWSWREYKKRPAGQGYAAVQMSSRGRLA